MPNPYLFMPEDSFFLIFIGIFVADTQMLSTNAICNIPSVFVIIVCLLSLALRISIERAKKDGQAVKNPSKIIITIMSLVLLVAVWIFLLPYWSHIIMFTALLVFWYIAAWLTPKIFELTHG
ncbi:MAG: hypothetical protein FWF80_01200 [Defluviitaleaceae bacterium]|nr:hypothetical protein [Defluviitaleaceae bacterium]